MPPRFIRTARRSVRDALPGPIGVLTGGTERILPLATDRDGLLAFTAVTTVVAGPFPHRRQCATTP